MRIISRLALVLLFLPLSGCQTENSSASDESRYSGGGSALFNEAKMILSARCVGCHAKFAGTEDSLVATGDLVKGDPTNSPIYYRLTGSTAGAGPKTMPTSGGALSVSEVQTIRDWIESAQ